MAIKGVLTVKDEQGTEQDFLPDTGLDNVICPDGARLNTKLQGAMDLLWTNPNPAVAFAAQTVNIDLSGYDAVLMLAANNGTSNWKSRIFVKVDEWQILDLFAEHFHRRPIRVFDGGVEFQNALYTKQYANSTADTQNGLCVPFKIYGIKFAPTYKTIQTDTAVDNYTNDEQVIGTWIDGKTLYRKVITTQFASSNAEQKVGELGTGVYPLKMYGTMFNGGTEFLTIPMSVTGGTTSYQYIRVALNGDVFLRSAWSGNVTLFFEYTKNE